MWRLCVDHKGNLLRSPYEVMHCWSLEMVLDAHAVMDMMQELLAEANKPKAAPKKAKP